MRALLAALVASHGFAAHGVHCAVGLPHLSGLVCAAASVKAYTYDGRGVVELVASGRVVVLRSGNDVLLAVDRAGRRALARGETWRAGRFACTNGPRSVMCRRGEHGFRLSAAAFIPF
jgi:hypothetical protein